MGINEATKQIHFPDNFEKYNEARKRLVFEELLIMQLALLNLKNNYEKDNDGIEFSKEAKKIIGKLKGPIVSTSANLSGEPSPKVLKDVNDTILKGVDLVLDECNTFEPEFTASTIIKLGLDNQVKVIRE